MEYERLGKYEIRGTLGKGAMGTVYDGYDAIIDRRVAIKTMSLPDSSDAEAQDELARFRREAQAAGRLTHPNIVAVYDYGEDGKIAFIVMEYAPGTELKKILDKGDRLPVAESLRIMDGLLAGLQYSHERGVVHRDIKPGNVIIKPDGTVKIADFGIARIESSSMTQAGTVMGTPAYMSPEQFMGQTVDARTDIYSSGVMLYQLLTGERPFEGGMTAIMHKALNTIPPRPSELSVTSPAALDAVVAKAMAKRPGDRFESAAAFAQALRDGLSGAAAMPEPALSDDATMVSAPRAPAAVPQAAPPRVVPAPQPPAAGKSKMPLVAGIAVAVLVAGGAGGYFMLSGSSTPPPVVAAATPSPAIAALTPQTALPDTPPSAPAPVAPAPVASAPVASAPAPVAAAAAPPAPPPVAAAPVPPAPAPVTAAAPPPVAKPAAPPAPAAAATVAAVAAAPAPAAVPAPVPVPVPVVVPPQPSAPAQTASIATSPALVRDAVAAALHPVACSLTRSLVDGRNVVISGLAGRDAGTALRSAARNAMPGNATPDSLIWRLDEFTGPYCDALDVVRPAASLPVSVGLQNGMTHLRKDDDIVPSVVMPDFPAWLQLDYFSSDGAVAHLHPTAISPGQSIGARGTAVFGNSAKERWQVDAPFGTDMILAIATSSPLFAAMRPADDTTQAYLQALRSALDDASRRGVRIAVGGMLVQTAPR